MDCLPRGEGQADCRVPLRFCVRGVRALGSRVRCAASVDRMTLIEDVHGFCRSATGARSSCCLVAAAVPASAPPIAPRDAAPPPIGTTLFTPLPSTLHRRRVREPADGDAASTTSSPTGTSTTAAASRSATSLATGCPRSCSRPTRAARALYLNHGQLPLPRHHRRRQGSRPRRASWTTGVTLADVNGDGRLDIYLCHAGSGEPQSARERALDQPGHATRRHADVQGDGRGVRRRRRGLLDPGRVLRLRPRRRPRSLRHQQLAAAGEQLRHPQPAQRRATSTAVTSCIATIGGGHFTDVSAQAGIFGSEIAFGLGRRRQRRESRRLAGHLRRRTTSSSATTSTSTTATARSPSRSRRQMPYSATSRWGSTSPTWTTTGGPTSTRRTCCRRTTCA